MVVFFLFMFTVYILQSLITGRYYVGHTDDLSRRIEEHNTGQAKYTRRGKPWRVVYTEKYQSRTMAMKREREIKGKKSRKYIQELIEMGERPDTPEA